MNDEILKADERGDEVLKADGVAAVLKITRRAVYDLVAEGEIPAYRLFGRRALRFKKAEILQLLKPNGGESKDEMEVNNAN